MQKLMSRMSERMWFVVCIVEFRVVESVTEILFSIAVPAHAPFLFVYNKRLSILSVICDRTSIYDCLNIPNYCTGNVLVRFVFYIIEMLNFFYGCNIWK